MVDVKVANASVVIMPLVDTVGSRPGVEVETSAGSKLDSGTIAIT